MATENQQVLDSGDAFPALEAETVGHGALRLPEHFGEDWGVVLVYRAHW
jgi:hypothetical protein